MNNVDMCNYMKLEVGMHWNNKASDKTLAPDLFRRGIGESDRSLTSNRKDWECSAATHL